MLEDRVKDIFYKNIIERLTSVSPTLVTYMLYFKNFKKVLNLSNPQTFNEKILWLKLYEYNNNPLVTQCADKYHVREYVKQCGCSNILNELYYVWNTSEEILWEELPNKFVLKCNHGCGYNIVCDDKSKLEKNKVLKQLDSWMSEDFWKKKAEINYKNIPKKIICEKYLDSEFGKRLTDYKVYCFNGKAKLILYCVDDTLGKRKFYFFDSKWRFLRINPDGLATEKDFYVEQPNCLKELLSYAEILSKPFPFVRVDFYVQNNNIIFGEMTFTPAAGLDTDRLPETDIMFGNMLKIK